MYCTVISSVASSFADLHRLHLDQVGEPLLQRRVDQLLLRRRQRVAVGREDELRGAAAEGRAVDALAGRHQQHLLDQVADMPSPGRQWRCGPSGRMPNGKATSISRLTCAKTRVCMTMRQRAACRSARRSPRRSAPASGCPFEVTRMVPRIHCPVTHGPPRDRRQRAARHHIGRGEQHRRLRRSPGRADSARSAAPGPPCAQITVAPT